VVKLFSALARKQIMDAASDSSSIRPRGILDRIILRNSGDWLSAMVVFERLASPH
jgi:hypothetical protein